MGTPAVGLQTCPREGRGWGAVCKAADDPACSLRELPATDHEPCVQERKDAFLTWESDPGAGLSGMGHGQLNPPPPSLPGPSPNSAEMASRGFGKREPLVDPALGST